MCSSDLSRQPRGTRPRLNEWRATALRHHLICPSSSRHSPTSPRCQRRTGANRRGTSRGHPGNQRWLPGDGMRPRIPVYRRERGGNHRIRRTDHRRLETERELTDPPGEPARQRVGGSEEMLDSESSPLCRRSAARGCSGPPPGGVFDSHLCRVPARTGPHPPHREIGRAHV